MAPFEPQGPRAKWRIVYDLLVEAAVNDVLTYDDMGVALGVDPVTKRHQIQMAMQRAAKEHERVDLRAVAAIPNVGYRVVEPQEHMALARNQQKRSSRALERGHSKVTNVDLNAMDPEVRDAFHVVAQAFSMQMEFNRRMDVRQKRLEDAVNSMSNRTTKSEDEIEQLKKRLARLEGQAE